MSDAAFEVAVVRKLGLGAGMLARLVQERNDPTLADLQRRLDDSIAAIAVYLDAAEAAS